MKNLKLERNEGKVIQAIFETRASVFNHMQNVCSHFILPAALTSGK